MSDSKTAIITGISGQDGAYLARLLLDKGYRVTGTLRPGASTDLQGLAFLGIADRVTLLHLDLLKADAVNALLEREQPEEIYNLAAQSSVGASFGEPTDTFQFNTLSVQHLLDAIRSVSPASRFYQASSSEMFGNVGQDRLPIRESMLFHPASPYAVSKAAAHWLAVNYREAYGVHACCGILFNHESCLRRDNFVIKKIISSALAIQSGAQERLELGNLAVQRDWGYAPAYVEVMWRMLQTETADDYLVCSGEVGSLEGMARLVFSELELDFDRHVSFNRALLRNVELDIIYGDNGKARRELSWEYGLDRPGLVRQLIADERAFRNWTAAS